MATAKKARKTTAAKKPAAKKKRSATSAKKKVSHAKPKSKPKAAPKKSKSRPMVRSWGARAVPAEDWDAYRENAPDYPPEEEFFDDPLDYDLDDLASDWEGFDDDDSASGGRSET